MRNATVFAVNGGFSDCGSTDDVEMAETRKAREGK